MNSEHGVVGLYKSDESYMTYGLAASMKRIAACILWTSVGFLVGGFVCGVALLVVAQESEPSLSNVGAFIHPFSISCALAAAILAITGCLPGTRR